LGTRPYSPYVVDSVPPPNPKPSNISSGSGLRAFNNLESILEVWLSASDGARTILLLKKWDKKKKITNMLKIS